MRVADFLRSIKAYSDTEFTQDDTELPRPDLHTV
jgi:hypothetical protein